jgi:hypothetical protein
MKPIRCKHGFLLSQNCEICGTEDHGIDHVKFNREIKLNNIREQAYQKHKNLMNAGLSEKEAFMLVINDVIRED